MISVGWKGNWLEREGLLLEETGGAKCKDSPSPAKWDTEGRARGGSLQR